MLKSSPEVKPLKKPKNNFWKKISSSKRKEKS